MERKKSSSKHHNDSHGDVTTKYDKGRGRSKFRGHESHKDSKPNNELHKSPNVPSRNDEERHDKSETNRKDCTYDQSPKKDESPERSKYTGKCRKFEVKSKSCDPSKNNELTNAKIYKPGRRCIIENIDDNEDNETCDEDTKVISKSLTFHNIKLNPMATQFVPKVSVSSFKENIPELANPKVIVTNEEVETLEDVENYKESSVENYKEEKNTEAYFEKPIEVNLRKSLRSPQKYEDEYLNPNKRVDRHKKSNSSFHTYESSCDTSLNSSYASSLDGWNDYSASPNTSGRLQSSRYKTSNHGSYSSRRSLPSDNLEKLTEFDIFKDKYRSLRDKHEFKIVKEIKGDLFEMDESYALANCVASDFAMGSGIAVKFRQRFKGVDELLAQNQIEGGLAFLNIDGRFIYYLVTKRESYSKPTYDTLYKSLTKLKQHMIKNKVKLLAIPRLGCGLDRLEWHRVKVMLEYIFQDTEVSIQVCNYDRADESMSETKEWLLNRKCPINYSTDSITTANTYSILLYLGTENGHVDNQLKELDTKFSCINDYAKSKRYLGKVITSIIQDYKYYVVGCIVKKKYSDLIDFPSFEKCVKEVNRQNKKFFKRNEHYSVVAIQHYYDPADPMLMVKLENLMRNTFSQVTIIVHNQD